MNGDRLIVAGNRGTGEEFRKYSVFGIVLAALGLFASIVGFSLNPNELYYEFGRNAGVVIAGIQMVGGILLVCGIATPFLARYQAKKCFIDVYETAVDGASRVQQKGQVDQYVPFHFTYQQIMSVSSSGNKVYLETASGRYECMAYNAEEICQAIRAKIKETF